MTSRIVIELPLPTSTEEKAFNLLGESLFFQTPEPIVDFPAERALEISPRSSLLTPALAIIGKHGTNQAPTIKAFGLISSTFSEAFIPDRMPRRSAVDFAEAAQVLNGTVDRIGLLAPSTITLKLWLAQASYFAQNTRLFDVRRDGDLSYRVNRLVVIPQRGVSSEWQPKPPWVGPKFEMVVDADQQTPAFLFGIHSELTYAKIKSRFPGKTFDTPGLEGIACSLPITFPEAWGGLSNGRFDIHYAPSNGSPKVVNDDWLGRRVQLGMPATFLPAALIPVAPR